MNASRAIRTLLIANRGEIACRIARTAARLGIRTVAVFSEADATASHVAAADIACAIGPAGAALSYLDIDRIIGAAKATGADAIHPGYGFLSENAAFARACADAGIVFVGPDVPAIEAMGSKAAAKAIMAGAGVPLVPGYHGEAQGPDVLAREAARIGFPVLLKASAGGGGKGMRVVEAESGLADAIAAARREAAAAFGDDRLLIEKYLTRPRHVEMQVFADRHGNVVHLFERDCSVQRRHQKVVEEAPAPGLAEDTRRAMAEAAVNAARAIDYVGAGTVEFIMDEDGGFYFMEMNTRLQVEHPVTEMITGQDLVAWQLRVAEGRPLPLAQEEIRCRGHAVEVRLYAEDPARGFLPQTGTLTRLAFPSPEAGPGGAEGGVRVDSGVQEGDTVTVHYDPMIAKLIVHAADRAGALRRMGQALGATRIAGLANNAAYLKRIVEHPAFRAGELDTGFIDRFGADLLKEPDMPLRHRIAAAAILEARRAEALTELQESRDPHSPWTLAHGWRLNGTPLHRIVLIAEGTEIPLDYRLEEGGYRFVDGMDETLVTITAGAGRNFAVRHGDMLFGAELCIDGESATLFLEGMAHLYVLKPVLVPGAGTAEISNRVTAPMPGRLIAVHVAADTVVVRGAPLMVLEAMKMEHVIRAPDDGVVAALRFAVGDQVEEGAELLRFEKTAGD